MLRCFLFLLCGGGLLASAFLPARAAAFPADPLEAWHWRNPLPQGNALGNVVFANGTFFALGSQGTLVTSSDGVAWTARSLGTSADLNDLAWANGRYVLVGSGGLVLTSPDGVNWSERTSGTFSDLRGVTYGNGMFIAVGAEGAILVSTEGSNWVRRTVGGTVWRDVAFNGSQFMVVGHEGETPGSPGHLYTSTDGVLWSRRTPPFPGRFSSVTAGHNLFVVVGGDGNILSSTDGAAWFSHGTGFVRLRGVTWSGSRFVAVGESTVFTSPDGLDWFNPASFPPEGGLGLIATTFGNGSYVAVGDHGLIFSSANASQWSGRTSGNSSSTLRGFSFGNGAFVAVGDDGTILGSSDGQKWQARVSGTSAHLTRVAFGNGLHVAIGPPHLVLTSSNGLSWTVRDSGLEEVLLDLTFGGGRFVALGIDGSVIVSTNGLQWTRSATSFAAGLNGITWSGSLFVAVGNLGTLATSLDGLTWTPRSTGQSETLLGIAAGNGLFVAVGDYGLVLTSTNLKDWSGQFLDGSLFLRHVQYAKGRFVMAGFSFDNPFDSGYIVTSTDGSSWTFRRLPAVATPLTAVAVAAGSFYVVGDRGTILQSDPFGELPPLLTLSRGSGGCPTLTLAGIIGQTYRIESTSVLRPGAPWQSRTNLTLNARVMPWTDARCMTGASLVYRAVAVP